MHEAIRTMLNRYDCQTRDDYVNALREILQELALLGLWRGKFFEHAASTVEPRCASCTVWTATRKISTSPSCDPILIFHSARTARHCCGRSAVSGSKSIFSRPGNRLAPRSSRLS